MLFLTILFAVAGGIILAGVIHTFWNKWTAKIIAKKTAKKERRLARALKDKRLPNITVYYISKIIDGIVYATPLGVMPRLSDEYENVIRDKYKPKGETYINETINEVTVILFWNVDRIDAISFLSADDAVRFSGVTKFPDDALAKLDGVLTHFPRVPDAQQPRPLTD
jgi:hypothetical protein